MMTVVITLIVEVGIISSEEVAMKRNKHNTDSILQHYYTAICSEHLEQPDDG